MRACVCVRACVRACVCVFSFFKPLTGDSERKSEASITGLIHRNKINNTLTAVSEPSRDQEQGGGAGLS